MTSARDSSTDFDDPSWLTLTSSRSEIVRQIDRKKECDVLVLGGGVAGSAFARLAAFNGLRTVLFEKNDYCSGTSGRTSKMVHGGLRYLEMLDFKQVREGVRAREALIANAPHLVRPHDFLIPISRADKNARLKFGFGLKIYDMLARAPKSRRHAWIDSTQLSGTPFDAQASELLGCYRFVDGIMDDTRLVLEQVLAARQEGAQCINYAELQTIDVRKDGAVLTRWTDLRDGSQHHLAAGTVINCAGAWAPKLTRLAGELHSPKVQYSRGIHLLFNKPWHGPAILFPLKGRGKNYFVWPHVAGTLVGTTDTPTDMVEWDPIPNANEVDELLARLERDLPTAGLTRETLHYGFSGIRTLPVGRKRSNATSSISRRHEWLQTSGMLTLLGGKYTTAAWAAEDGLKKLLELSGSSASIVSLADRKFPGAGELEVATDEFRQSARDASVDPVLVDRAIQRFGSRVRHFVQFKDPLAVIGGIVLKGEVELVIATEQVESLEDLIRRRLGLEYLPGAALEALEEIAAILKAKKPDLAISEEIQMYRNRIERIRAAFRV